MGEEKAKLVIMKSPDYRLVYSTGVFGGLNPSEGQMIFYVDRIIPKTVENIPGQMKTEAVERELQVEIHMPLPEFISLSHWMQSHIKRLEQEGVLVKKEETKT